LSFPSTVIVPSSVGVLSVECFSGCISLRELIFENDSNPKQIKHRIFDGYISLKELSFPKSVDLTEKSAFADYCLEHLTIDAANSALTTDGAELRNRTSVCGSRVCLGSGCEVRL
jgi:hypothetical protein